MPVISYFSSRFKKKDDENNVFIRETIEKLHNIRNEDIHVLFETIKKRVKRNEFLLYKLFYKILREFFPLSEKDSVTIVWDHHLAYASVLLSIEFIESDLSDNRFIRFKAVTKYGLLFTIDFHSDGKIEYDLVLL